VPSKPSRQARLREARLRDVLDAVRAGCDEEAERDRDPVGIVHRYADPEDREIVALVASAMAFGNVKALRAKIEDALARTAPSPARAADDPAKLGAQLRGWKHRIYRDRDLAALLVGARRVQRSAGSLGAALGEELAKAGALRPALSAWVARIRAAGGVENDHILADPEKGSAVKRLMLLLRWMGRPADGVDLGGWPVPPSKLLIPVDTHIHKLGYNLGLTDRKDVSWKTAEEITASLRRFDAEDPVKYDFSLCHLGMAQRCPSRRDEERCDGCGVKGVCRHWG
jgi:uncharacterized protein (TIGR02757 family)